MSVSLGVQVPIYAATGTRAFRFSGGDVCVEGGPATSVWSGDNGLTWTTTPIGGRAAPGPGCGTDETRAIYWAGSRIVSFARTLTGSASPYNWACRRSTDDWVTVVPEVSTVSLTCVPYIPPGGGKVPAMLFDRGMLQVASGDLAVMLYGNKSADVTPVQGWPTAFGAKKARIIVASSGNSGGSWTEQFTLMNNIAIGRGTDPSPDPADIDNVPMVSQEGTTLNDVVIAPNGDILSFARSGARISTQEAGAPPTPIYYTVSTGTYTTSVAPKALSLGTDETVPGDAPSVAVTTNNRVILGITYPTTRIYQSNDNGVTFTEEAELCEDTSGVRMTLLPLTAARVLAIYKDTTLPGKPFTARILTVT